MRKPHCLAQSATYDCNEERVDVYKRQEQQSCQNEITHILLKHCHHDLRRAANVFRRRRVLHLVLHLDHCIGASRA